jgi:WD40 repeat protein
VARLGGLDGTILLHARKAGGKGRKLSGCSPKSPWLAFRPDGRALAAAGVKGEVRLWDVATGESREVLPPRGGVIRSVTFSPGGGRLASAAHDGSILVNDLASGRALHRLQLEAPATAMAFGPDGKTLACVFDGPEPPVRVWDLSTDQVTSLYGHRRGCGTVVFHPAGHLLATADAEGTVRLWSWDRRAGGRQLRVLGPGPFGSAVHQVAFTPEGRYLATANANGTVYLLRLDRVGSGPAAPRPR